MSKKYIARFVFNIAFFSSVIWGAWWMPAVIGIVLLIMFNAWEVVLGAILMDLLYHSPYAPLSFPAVWTASSIILFFAFRSLRSKLF